MIINDMETRKLAEAPLGLGSGMTRIFRLIGSPLTVDQTNAGSAFSCRW